MKRKINKVHPRKLLVLKQYYRAVQVRPTIQKIDTKERNDMTQSVDFIIGIYFGLIFLLPYI